jgi:hypothetical protein
MEQQHTLYFPTDTSVPQTPIPIFFIHAGEHPFCLTPGCICHSNEARIKEILHDVLDGDLKLRKAYNGLIVGRGIK